MIGRTGRLAEKQTARRLAARVRPASGAMPGLKGDMVAGEFLIEAKSTTAHSMGLKRDWLAKIAAEAENQGLTPALAVAFTDKLGKPVRYGAWIAVPESVFEDMQRALAGLTERIR